MSESTSGAAPPLAPKTGEVYRCEKCELEVSVTKGCQCDPPCAEFRCCGQMLTRVSAS